MKSPRRGKCTKKHRLLIMFLLVGGLFLFEIIVGYFTHSLALIADSFHMLGNEVTLLVAYVAVRVSSKKWKKSTFGLARAEVLAALINAVFTVALSFSMTVKSFERFLLIEKIIRPKLMLIAGSVGLLINIIESFSFHGYGSSRNFNNQSVTYYFSKLAETKDVHVQTTELRKDVEANNNQPSKNSESDVEPDDHKKPENFASSHRHFRRLKYRLHPGHMHVRAIFVHALTGTISSILIIASSLIYLFCTWNYKYYLDPSVSLIIALLIFCSVWSLLRDSALILLQTVPKHIKIEGIKQRLLEKVDGVLAIHELHVWQLAGNRIIASVHIRCKNISDYMAIAGKVKEFFHNEGIHSTTVQPEFDEADLTNRCIIVCPKPNEACLANRCCAVSSKLDMEAQSS